MFVPRSKTSTTKPDARVTARTGFFQSVLLTVGGVAAEMAASNTPIGAVMTGP
jgi:hypothetical protein